MGEAPPQKALSGEAERNDMKLVMTNFSIRHPWFVIILFLGLVYMWNRGDLKWTKEVPEELEAGIILEEEKPIMF